MRVFSMVLLRFKIKSQADKPFSHQNLVTSAGILIYYTVKAKTSLRLINLAIDRELRIAVNSLSKMLCRNNIQNIILLSIIGLQRYPSHSCKTHTHTHTHKPEIHNRSASKLGEA
uniref:Uncharacterized protein n=1 Tax=Micrurus corallinus TaxID=54390 RepID=A0A2D4FMK8_MICCO